MFAMYKHSDCVNFANNTNIRVESEKVKTKSVIARSDYMPTITASLILRRRVFGDERDNADFKEQCTTVLCDKS